VRLAALGVLSLVAFAAWIGLASFWRHGRRLYVVSWASWILYVLFTGPRVTTSVSSAFMSLDALAAGAILGLVYFSDLARRFERPTVADGALAGTRFSAGGA
jgi:hypothetical protein